MSETWSIMGVMPLIFDLYESANDLNQQLKPDCHYSMKDNKLRYSPPRIDDSPGSVVYWDGRPWLFYSNYVA